MGTGIFDCGTVFLYDICGDYFFHCAFWHLQKRRCGVFGIAALHGQAKSAGTVFVWHVICGVCVGMQRNLCGDLPVEGTGNITLEFLILYLAGEHLAPQLLGIVRVAPAMASFFSMMYLMDDMEVMGDISMMKDMGSGLMQVGAVAVAAALVLWAVAIVICVKVTAKRDYV